MNPVAPGSRFDTILTERCLNATCHVSGNQVQNGSLKLPKSFWKSSRFVLFTFLNNCLMYGLTK
jgi:hypothetical protein